jgi:PhzF family phenazine biosynthesis protein
MARFKQVDVFTAVPYLGNPVAVVLDASGIDEATMQRFTDWTNLSEATFVLPPTHADADYRLRIFCPGRELPFAGHPTLGSCHAWLEAGGRPRRDAEIVQECGAGLVHIRRDGEHLAFQAPPRLRSGPLEDAELDRVVRGLGLRHTDVVAHAWCDNGPPWQAVLLHSAEQVLSVQPDRAALDGSFVGLVAPHASGECDFEVRAFFPGQPGLIEDPVTGSLNAALGQWLIEAGHAPPRYVAAQGTVLGRAGRVHVSRAHDGSTWISGASTTCVDGSVTL